MKNNTKLIMENWRKFLKEGPGDEDGFVDPNGDIPGVGKDGFPEAEPDLGDEALADEPVSDTDLSARDTFHAAEGVVADALDDGATQSAADKAGIDYAGAHGMNAFGEPIGDDYDYGSYDPSDMSATLTTNQVEPSDYDSDDSDDSYSNIEARGLYDDDGFEDSF